MKLKHFESEADFRKAIEQFSVLCGGFLYEWKPTYARKEHDDLFNVRIEPCETYFRKDLGGHTYDSAEKLSMASMEKVVYIVIELNPILGTRLQKKIDEDLRNLSRD